MTAYRILVTGSRTWRMPHLIRHTLNRVAAEAGRDTPIALLHGNSGNADLGSAAHATRRSWQVQAFHANWDMCADDCPPDHRRRKGDREYCPTAGHRRNQQMVDEKPDVLVAFVRDHSRGASDCMRRAQAAGVRIVAVHDCGCHRPDGTPFDQPTQLDLLTN